MARHQRIDAPLILGRSARVVAGKFETELSVGEECGVLIALDASRVPQRSVVTDGGSSPSCG